MDRGEEWQVDVREGLDSTLILLKNKLKHTEIEWSAIRPEPGKLTVHAPSSTGVDQPDDTPSTRGASGRLPYTTRRDGDCAEMTIAGRRARHSRRDRDAVRPVLQHQGGRQQHRARPGHRTPYRSTHRQFTSNHNRARPCSPPLPLNARADDGAGPARGPRARPSSPRSWTPHRRGGLHRRQRGDPAIGPRTAACGFAAQQWVSNPIC